MKMPLFTLVACVAVVWVGSGCDTSKTGANNLIKFTPENCGQAISCNFDDGIGEGGRIDVQVQAIEDTPTAGLDLASDDLSILRVAPTLDIDNEPAWELIAGSPGAARLAVLDSVGEEVDYIHVIVKPVDAISSFNADEDARRGATTTISDEGWAVRSDTTVDFYIEATSSGKRTMGRYTYEVDLDQGIEEGLKSDPTTGHLKFKVPANIEHYYGTFRSELGPTLTVLFGAHWDAP